MEFIPSTIEFTDEEKNAVRLIDDIINSLCYTEDRECQRCPLNEVCSKINSNESVITQLIKDMITKGQ